ncbi:phage major capsid protein, HK97 family [Archaeoglobus sulfaticallidus PM70-1]|uniref:Phage major capsid protein, HK97 family n=1 Tax=Archaeoglobus sulfaticallidus PM70-1 TaxID=387631 RepID=N0BLT1_9EURY|nr:phage major capsid protein [Archaeoglobus sulfaticallidus]AGK61496.1 phage major capsid protein, HK97 family [Archaeoglobus sulfaticallidus PM70-1]
MPVTTTDLGTGVMNRQQANRFIQMVQEQAVLLKKCRVLPVNHPKGQIDKIGVASRILRSPAEGETVTSEASVTIGSVNYDTVKVMLKYGITNEAIEDNIERENLANTIAKIMAQQFSVDLEDLAINADTATDAANPDYDFLKIDDGWIKQGATGTHTYDHGGATINKDLFSQLIRTLPNKYRRPGLVWIMSPDQLEAFKDYLTNRATAAGDALLISDKEVMPRGFPVITPPKWPDDQVWLTIPQNLIVVIQRNITVRKTTSSDEVIDKDLYAKYAMTARVDFIIEEKDAIARAINIAAP